MTARLTPERVGFLARRAVDRIDRDGARGITLCTMQEIEALAIVAAVSGLLPPRDGGAAGQTPMFKSRREK